MCSAASLDFNNFTDILKVSNVLTKHEGLPKYSSHQIISSTVPGYRKYRKTLRKYLSNFYN